MQRTTIKDIAAAAGVSHTTVSYVLNKNPNQKISDKTRRKVIETARKWWRPLASLRRQVVERHGRNASRLPFSCGNAPSLPFGGRSSKGMGETLRVCLSPTYIF